MNFSNILNQIAEADPEVFERTSERRAVIRNWSRRVGLAAVPFALGSLFKKAYGKGTATVVEVLNFALKLEFLEAEYYTRAYTAANGATPTLAIPTGAPMEAIKTIRDHEQAHVQFLTDTIKSLGGMPIDKPTNYDFSGGKGAGNGPFAGSLTNYPLFLALAQAFEDTGVRAYKGSAGDLMGNDAVLTAALQIHSVEARHASHIRQMRKNAGQADVKPWITMAMSGIAGGAADSLYAGEDNTTQASVQIPGINGQLVSVNAASEAFDEPLTMSDVLPIVSLFIP